MEKKSIRIVEKSKLWFAISIIIIIVGLAAWGVRGLNLGIDFAGGTIVNINIGQELNNEKLEEIRTIAVKYDSQALVQAVQGNEVTIRGKEENLTNENVKKMFEELKTKYNLKDEDLLETQTIGPSVGRELQKNAILSSIVAVAGILIYVSIRFEFKMGVAAIVALVHDVLITISAYALFYIPVNSPFIAAILTILGYSINDTIVIFDRIRENRKIGGYKDYKDLVNASITQTLVRSINTGLSTLVTITALYIVGVSAIQEFAAPLIIGILSGTYSSIFIASPLWIVLERKKKLA